MGGEGSSNVRRYLDALPFAPRQIDIGDEQESHNQHADISAEDLGNSYQQYLHLDLSCALDCDEWVMQSS